jgi:hypothetical protein
MRFLTLPAGLTRLAQVGSLFVFAASLYAVGPPTTDLDQTPQKGLIPDFSYNLSNIETISNANGNVSLRIPVATLPRDRDGQQASLNLIYNSKLWEATAAISPGPDATGALGDCGRGAEVEYELIRGIRPAGFTASFTKSAFCAGRSITILTACAGRFAGGPAFRL